VTGRFAGRVALVTGGSRGIGLGIARRIVAEGGRVTVTGRKQASLDEAVAELGGAGTALGIPGSADDDAHQDLALAATLEAFGRLDVLVNNTGINPAFGPLVDVAEAGMRKMLDTNVIANLAWVRKTLAAAWPDGGGAVVNVVSVAGLRPAAGIGFYGATKAALVHLTGQLALELAPRVRVNAVAPAIIRTRFAGPLYDGREDEVAAGYPMGRLGEPADVAAAVAYLASDDAAWVTGQVLVVDGGLLLGGGI
jgi:NAD(P)-dependent dehydrogenase (short-subunit alcohol dehydrogenase family)